MAFGLLLAEAGCAAAPAAALPAAPACAGPVIIADYFFLVFFGEHSATMSERARQVATEQAKRFKRSNGRFMILDGHTDTSEAAPRDRGLGLRRAAAVAAFLRGLGIPGERIAIRNLGATKLLVPTPPGVAEAQNRRVDGLFDFGESDDQRAERLACIDWLRATYCNAPANASTADTCRAALGFLDRS